LFLLKWHIFLKKYDHLFKLRAICYWASPLLRQQGPRRDHLSTASPPRSRRSTTHHLPGPGPSLTTAMSGGTTIPHNKRWHTVAGKGLCAVMWYALPHFPLLLVCPSRFDSSIRANPRGLLNAWVPMMLPVCALKCDANSRRNLASRFGDLGMELRTAFVSSRDREGHVELLALRSWEMLKSRNVLPFLYVIFTP
jgi:hypothetical protein